MDNRVSDRPISTSNKQSLSTIDVLEYSVREFRKLIMKLKVVIHTAEEGGYWAEVPAIPGCATQGDSFEELLQNIYEAVEGCLSVDEADLELDNDAQVFEIAI